MTYKSYWGKIFVAGALWNCAASLALYFFHGALFSLLGMPPIDDSMFAQLFFMAAFLFGVGYYWVSRDLSRNHGIIKLGIAGKILVFAIMTYHLIFHNCIHWFFASAGVVDLIFAGFFIKFLTKESS
jgi:hypothetical protein